MALSFGLFVCLYGIFSFYVKERLYMGEAPLAVLLGIILGPYGLGRITHWSGEGEDEENADKIALGFSRVVIGIQLVLVGIQLPKYYPVHEARSLTMLLLPVMVCSWLIVAGLIMLVIPNVPFLVALVIAASTTPTDPILANSICKGAFADQYVPARVRNIISAESGMNDGLAYPFLFLAIRLIKSPTTTEALTTWIFQDVLYTVGGAVVAGIVVGVAANRALRFACRNSLIDKESFLLFGPLLGITMIGMAGAAGLDDLLAVFVAGNAFTYDDWYRKETEEDEVQNVLDFLLNSAFFAFAGAAIPFITFNMPEIGTSPLRLLLLALLVLLFRRLPPMLLLYKGIPAFKDIGESAFAGYFGPIGAGAIYYASEILEEFPKDEIDEYGPNAQRVRDLVRPIAYSLILASLIGHTMAIPCVKLVFTWKGTGSIKLLETQRRDEHASQQERAEESYEEGQGDAPEDAANTQQEGGHSHGVPHPPDVELGQPPSSVHPTTRMRHGGTARGVSNEDGGSVASGSSRKKEVADAYQRGLDASWKKTSGHKLGTHLGYEHTDSEGEREHRHRGQDPET